MNPMELFNQVKEMIEKKDFEAKSLVSGNEMVSGALDKIKGLF